MFIRFYMEFTSLLFLETKEKGNKLLHLGPWKFVSSQGRSLAEGTEQGRGGAWFSGVVRPRRRGGSWGKGGGSRGAPLGGLGSREDGPRRPVRGEGRPAALRRGNRGAEGSASTVGGRGSGWAGRFLRMEAGGVSSTGAGRRRPWVLRRQLAGSLGRR